MRNGLQIWIEARLFLPIGDVHLESQLFAQSGHYAYERVVLRG